MRETRNRTERLGRVHERSTRLLKTAGYLGEAQDHEADNDGADDDRPESIYPEQCMQLRGQAEDAGAHDAIDHQRQKIPAADRAQQSSIAADVH
jgi:hypothetical protein